MVLARAAYNLAEGGLGTTSYLPLPPPQVYRFFVFRAESSAKRK